MRQLLNPATHNDWVIPHSYEWYAQLARLTGQYNYSWNSTITEPNGESRFTEEVAAMVRNKTVLDIGCGHGEYAMQWSPVAKQVVGVDVTEDFVVNGNENNIQNVSFVSANTRNGLPFQSEQFDCAYNRRGPTSSYLDLKRVIRAGGEIIGLHPGDAMSFELSQWFPGLFESKPDGTPTLDNIIEKLDRGGFQAQIETVRAVEYLHQPIDIITLRCFGQEPTVVQTIVEECLQDITAIFEKYATGKGLPTTHERYIVRSVV
jgi:SAM-dependent methyltransferase